MKMKFIPFIATFLLAMTSCGPTSTPISDPTENPTSDPTSLPSDPTTVTTEDPTTSNPTTTKPKFKFSVEVPMLYVNYPGEEPIVECNDPEVDISTISYSWDTTRFDADDLTFSDGKFSTKTKNLLIDVTATLNGKEDEFTIYTSEYGYESQVTSREKAHETYKDYVEGTIFLGDSFFDTDIFWTNFYTTYQGKNARSVGISATQTHDWEMFAERLVYPTNPENIVMHIGTNNMFDGKQNADTTIRNLEKMLEKYHTDLPNTHIYYFGIEPRTYSLPYKVSMKESIAEITKVNEAMIAYAAENEYFTYLDSPSLCYNSDGSVKESFFKDGIHPKLENYSYYVKLLEDAGITYKKVKGVSNYSDFTTQKSQNSGATGLVVIHEGTQLTNNYVMSGTIDITGYNSNPHIIFSFDSTNFQNRFLLWDNDANGTFNLGYAVNGGHEANAPIDAQYTMGSNGLKIEWKIVATDKNAYLFINGTLKIAMLNAPLSCFFIASENAETSWTNMSAFLKEDDETSFADAINNSNITTCEETVKTDSTRKIQRF